MYTFSRIRAGTDIRDFNGWRRRTGVVAYRPGDLLSLARWYADDDSRRPNQPQLHCVSTQIALRGKYYVHQGGFYPTYDVTRDGQFFLMIEPQQQAAANRLIVVVNWVQELRRRIPAKARRYPPVTVHFYFG